MTRPRRSVATLGTQSLHAGLLAGAIGLGLVIVYCFIYYRALGLVTVASLLVSALLVYGSVVLLGQAVGFTLTLAGIAGLIVSVGITADSFVVYYERLKDEIREGRTMRTAVEVGWTRARRTILSADTVSFLAAVILYVVSIGDVRGFAFTLGLSTLLDVAVVFLFTKPVVTLLLRRRFFATSKYSGLSAANVGGHPQIGRYRASRPRSSGATATPTAPAGGATDMTDRHLTGAEQDDVVVTDDEQAATADAPQLPARHHSLFSRLSRGEVNADFIGRRKTWYTISGVVVLISILSLIFRGFTLGIDFKGGDTLQFKTNGHAAAAAAARTVLDNNGVSN